MRIIEVFRQTGETKIYFTTRLENKAYIFTGIPYFDHMLHQISLHSGLNFSVYSVGDGLVDKHHLIEDVGITIGFALKKLTNNFTFISRYGYSAVLLDESLTKITLDLSGRTSVIFRNTGPTKETGSYDNSLTLEFVKATARTACISMHLDIIRGYDVHHKTESVCKGLGRAMNLASKSHNDEFLSTKGKIL